MTGYYNTFVVRLWCEEGGKQVRGCIEHTGSREHAYFESLEDMNDRNQQGRRCQVFVHDCTYAHLRFVRLNVLLEQ